MFLDTSPTPFDLRFTLFRTPVRVHPLFWVGMALFGQHTFLRGFEFGLIWVACGFVSLLAHEFGHVFAARWLTRSPASIVLYLFGGIAVPTYVSPHPWRRLGIAAGGPAAGFALVGVLWASDRAAGWATGPYPNAAYRYALFMGLVWNAINLLPVWPFDGGRIAREAFVLAGRRRPDALTHGLSVAVAGLIGGYGLLFAVGAVPVAVAEWVPWWLHMGTFGVIFFLLLAVQNYMLLQRLRRTGPRLFVDDDDDGPPWRRRAVR